MYRAIPSMIFILILLLIIPCSCVNYVGKNKSQTASYPISNFPVLNEHQKADLVAIASQDTKVKETQSNYSIQETRLVWCGVFDDTDIGALRPYIDTEDRIPEAWKGATIYPGVNFNFGSFVITVAVDLDKRQIISETITPNRQLPITK
jgi:hypothetical protein